MKWLKQHGRELMWLLLIPALIAGALIAPAWVNMESDKNTRQLLCQNAYLSRVQLDALKHIGREIGIPADFGIPPMPPECDDFNYPTVDATLLARPPCTSTGTTDDDMRTTGEGKDVLCLLAGDDYGHTNGGRDVILAGAGDDALVGGKGWDRLRGGNGDDFLFSIDGLSNDRLRGAGGTDKCFADPGDVVTGCEQVHRGNTTDVLDALLKMTYDALSLGEETQTLLSSAPACGRENPPEWCG